MEAYTKEELAEALQAIASAMSNARRRSPNYNRIQLLRNTARLPQH